MNTNKVSISCNVKHVAIKFMKNKLNEGKHFKIPLECNNEQNITGQRTLHSRKVYLNKYAHAHTPTTKDVFLHQGI